VAARHEREYQRPTAPVVLQGTDLSRWSAEEIEAVAHALNTRPRKTLGWKTPAEALNAHLLLLQQAGVASPVRSGQYTSIAFTERLAALGMKALIGTVGDAYDNAMAESTIGLYQTELIRRRGPWRT
jgi:transposase InsO family protein